MKVVTPQALSQAKSHCFRRAACKAQLIPVPYATESDFCTCESALMNSYHTYLNCTALQNCLNQHTDNIYNEMLQIGFAAVRGIRPSSLIQQSTAIIDHTGCINVSAYDVEQLECDCWAEMEHNCTENGTLSLSPQELYDCVNQILCDSWEVCLSWKSSHCDSGASVLAIEDIGNAEQELRIDPHLQHRAVTYEEMRQHYLGLNFSESEVREQWSIMHTAKEDLAVVADEMQGRRQPPTNSSSEPLLLEPSLSAKTGCPLSR